VPVRVNGNMLRPRRCRVEHRTGSPGAGDCVVCGQCGCEHDPTGSLPPFQTSDEAVLKEMAELADQHGVEMRSVARANLAAVDAILRQARLGEHNLPITRAARRAGPHLAFGNIADAALEASGRSVVRVAARCSREPCGAPGARPQLGASSRSGWSR
jgi:hypothetical protein